jgi:poly(3-hydroxybutyrate) depolymerase
VLHRVYPGFVQLYSFMSMNMSRHQDAHQRYFDDLVKGDGDGADKHLEFYDEYLSVLDLPEEFYLQTIDIVFQTYLLPKGELVHDGRLVRPERITDVGLMTVEGEHDDISGVGQTEAAQHLCVNIPEANKAHWLQPGVGHYGVFNGSRFRSEIAPRISDFVLSHDFRHAQSAKSAKSADSKSADSKSADGNGVVPLRKASGGREPKLAS